MSRIIKSEREILNRSYIEPKEAIRVEVGGSIADENNSTDVALIAGGVYTGTATDILNYGVIYVTIKSDAASAEDGLSIQQSPDGINWDHCDEYTINADSGKTFSFQAAANYFRIVYTNGASPQTYLRLQTVFKNTNGKPSSHRIKDDIVNDDDAELVKSIMSVQTNDDNTYVNVDVQNPIPADGDSVYGKDLLLDLSGEGNFTIPTEAGADKRRILTSFVSDVFIAKIDSTANNPKIVELFFRRPISSTSFGINSGPGGDFSNTKVTIAQGEFELVVVDDSLDNTKQVIQIYPISPVKFSSMKIEFHTADEVSIGLIGIFKSIETAARLQALKSSDGTVVDIEATDSGNLKTSNAESGLAIAQGNVVGTEFIHKFGEAANIDTTDGFADVWDGTNNLLSGKIPNYTFSTIADIDSITSSDILDTQVIEVQGLDTNYELTVQNVTLTGQTTALLTTPLIRVFRMKNIDSIDILGEVYLRTNGSTVSSGVPDTTNTVRAIINDGNNQTLMAIVTIPAGRTGFMRDWYASLSKDKATSCIIKVKARPFGQVFQLKHISAINSGGTSYIQHTYEEPERFTEKTDIIISANTTTNDSGVGAGFDIVSVENV